MEEATQKYLLEFRLISNIPKNGQLDTTGRNLVIFHWSIPNWIYRFVTGDGRDRTIVALKQTYINANKFADELTKIIDPDDNNNMLRLLISFAERMCESLEGVRHLRTRYKEDNTISVYLQHIEADIIIPKLNKLIDIIPVSRRSTIIIDHIQPFDIESKEITLP